MAMQVTLLFGLVSMSLIDCMRRHFSLAYGMEPPYSLAFVILMVALFFAVYDAVQPSPAPTR